MKHSNVNSEIEKAQKEAQSYLIARFREALKAGDKSSAKSCLLATRLFSVNEPTIANEIYVMAKADGNIQEAARSFAEIFENLFVTNDHMDNFANIESLTGEALVVANQIKDETRYLLNELKNQHLKLRSNTVVIGSNHARQVPSVSQSPLLSPRLRMSSEDRCLNRDSMLRIDKHLDSSSNTLFYQRLLDALNERVRRFIINYSIANCDDPFESCRLMILALSLYNDEVVHYGGKLLKTLIDLSNPANEDLNNDRTYGIPRNQTSTQYAKSMLTLDAIPLIFSIENLDGVKYNMDEILQHTINYYSEFCLERAAEEYEFKELHEGVRKAIAARILAKDINYGAYEENLEESLNACLDLLLDRFLREFSNDTATIGTLKKLRSMVGSSCTNQSVSSAQVRRLIAEYELQDDIPENILFGTDKDESVPQNTTPTPPPKARGRPKKVQATVIVSPDAGVRRHLQQKAKEAKFIFTTYLQHMFTKCSLYLKQTRSRILMNFDNPLASQIETEVTKSSSQRTLRGKSIANDATGTTPSKKVKLDSQVANDSTKTSDSNSSDEMDNEEEDESPLESEHSKKMDREILDTLTEIYRCMVFLETAFPAFEKLFSRFLTTVKHKTKWFLRIHVDCMMISMDFDSAIDSLYYIMERKDETYIKRERNSGELSTLTVSTGTSPSVEVYKLRAYVQAVCCCIQSPDKEETLKTMAKLLDKIKQSGLLTNDVNYSTGNVIDEFRIVLSGDDEPKRGFLFFDALSLLRYVVVILMDILERYVTNPSPNSDSIIGHSIVLSQIDWPAHVQIYDKCISWIRANKPRSTTPQCLSASTKFTYSEFFNFILEPSMLEDFMALLNEGITLDIKKQGGTTTSPGGSSSQQTNSSTASARSSSSSTRSGKAITTRGVNKTFKEDLKVALIAQMKNSSTLIPLNLIADFIERTLIPHLLSLK